MYEYSPKPDRRLAYAAVFICLFLGIFLFAPLSFADSVLLWLRAGGIWAFAAAFMISDRYLLISYTYLIEENSNGAPDFVVSELHFKKRRTVCRISLSEIESIEFIKKGKPANLPNRARAFNSRSEFLTSDCYLLRGETADGKFFIKFSPDVKMANIIHCFLAHKN